MIKYTIEIKSVDNQIREYDFYSEEIGALGEIKDEIRIKQGQVYVLKRIGFTKEFLSYVLPEEELIKAEEIDKIKLFKGTNEVRVKDINGNYVLEYYIDNPELELLATQEDLDDSKSQIALLEGQANLKVSKANLITEINQSAETVGIKADKIKLEGHSTINEGFSVDIDGNMQCRDANINNLVNKSGTYNLLTFSVNKSEAVSQQGRGFWEMDHYVGYKLNSDNQQRRVPIYISYSVPSSLLVDRAFLEVKHFSVTWIAGDFGEFTDVVVSEAEIYLKKKENSLTTYIAKGDNYEKYGEGPITLAEEPILNPEHFIGERMSDIWGEGIHSYTFPTGRQTKKTRDISTEINETKQGIIAIAPQATNVNLNQGEGTIFDPNLPPEMRPLQFSAYMSATLYIYGYLDKKE